MRWRFPDERDEQEAAARNETLCRIDEWWKAFAERAADIEESFRHPGRLDLPGFMHRTLQAVDERLCWEFGPALCETGDRLVITPESERQLRPMVQTLLGRAPSLPGWEFYPYRPPGSVEMARLTVAARCGDIRAPDAQVKLARGSANLVDLTYRAAAFRSLDEGQARHAALVFTETLLGEEAMDKWVGAIQVEPAPAAGVLSGLFGKGRGGGGFVPLDRARSTFEAVVASIRDQLPPRPLYDVNLRREGHGWSSFTLEPEDRDDYPERLDLFVGITGCLDIAQATFDPASFRSERFSRCGETFCYLKIDGIDGLDPAHFEDRAAVEDAMDALLVPAKVGCTIGGGTGKRYSYVELALQDVERSARLIRDRLQAGNVPHRTWLLFHDPELADEWIGMCDDTPPPPRPPEEQE